MGQKASFYDVRKPHFYDVEKKSFSAVLKNYSYAYDKRHSSEFFLVFFSVILLRSFFGASAQFVIR